MRLGEERGGAGLSLFDEGSVGGAIVRMRFSGLGAEFAEHTVPQYAHTKHKYSAASPLTLSQTCPRHHATTEAARDGKLVPAGFCAPSPFAGAYMAFGAAPLPQGGSFPSVPAAALPQLPAPRAPAFAQPAVPLPVQLAGHAVLSLPAQPSGQPSLPARVAPAHAQPPHQPVTALPRHGATAATPADASGARQPSNWSDATPSDAEPSEPAAPQMSQAAASAPPATAPRSEKTASSSSGTRAPSQAAAAASELVSRHIVVLHGAYTESRNSRCDTIVWNTHTLLPSEPR